MHDFKAGETIVMKEECSHCLKGEKYTLIDYNGRLYTKGPKYPSEMCSCQEKWIPIRTPEDEFNHLLNSIVKDLGGK